MHQTLYLLFFPFIVFSQTIYVSPLGNNELGDGTINNPFHTIQYAIDNGANEILLLEGIYTISEVITGSDIII